MHGECMEKFPTQKCETQSLINLTMKQSKNQFHKIRDAEPRLRRGAARDGNTPCSFERK